MFQKLSLNTLNTDSQLKKTGDVSKRVMLGAQPLSLGSSANFRGADVTNETHDLLIKLFQANSARSVYEAAVELPLDDLFYVGGQLQTLIRRAELAIRNEGPLLAEYVANALSFRVAEAKAFRKYIVKRIRMGA
jgi:hypothetical protein